MSKFISKKFKTLLTRTSLFVLSGCSAGSLELGNETEVGETPPPSYAVDETSAQLRLANRHYIAAELLQIFGNGVQNDINNFVVNQISSLAGPCEIYSTTNDIYSGCANDPAKTQAPILASDTAPYAAYALVRACDAVLGKGNTGLSFASTQVIQRIGNYTSLSPNEDEIRRVWEQFNPGDTLASELLTEFQNLILAVKQKAYPVSEEWRFLYLVNCYNAGRLVP